MHDPFKRYLFAALGALWLGTAALTPVSSLAQQVPNSASLVRALDAKQYSTAFQIASELAAQNDAAGQTALGDLYSGGRGVPRDASQAVNWYRKAAAQGDAKGQFSLGIMYYQGRGVPKDIAEALDWLRKSAEQGYIPAEVSLGYLTETGEAVRQDPAQAAKWYRQALEGFQKATGRADPATQAALGFLYEEGRGVQRDYAQAAALYRTAADRDHPDAQSRLCYLLYSGLGVKQDPVEALTWCAKAAEQGNAWAQNQLGYMYEAGLGAQKNIEQAKAWYEKAAAQGQSYAAERLRTLRSAAQDAADRLPKQTSTPATERHAALSPLDVALQAKDLAKALQLAKEMADQNDPYGQKTLGDLLYAGVGGIQPDVGQAAEWYRKAAGQGYAPAQVELGNMYASGSGTKKNPVEATHWYQQAADHEYGPAIAQLGYIYGQGWSVEKDVQKAKELINRALPKLTQAAEVGDLAAQYFLGRLYLSALDERDADRALALFRKAAAQGYPRAQHALGDVYRYGMGGSKDSHQAIAWFLEAADRGYAPALHSLGSMYAAGEGVAQDYSRAIELYRKAADRGWLAAYTALGAMYSSGNGVQQDYGEAAVWYRKAAEQGEDSAQSTLGYMYFSGGLGLPQDDVQAIMWFRMAAGQGNAVAEHWLGYMYESGRGTQKDLHQARSWYEKAAANGQSAAVERLKSWTQIEPQPEHRASREGTSCELRTQPIQSSYYRNITMSWDGDCVNGLASGTGTVTWYSDGVEFSTQTFTRKNGATLKGGVPTASDDVIENYIKWQITECTKTRLSSFSGSQVYNTNKDYRVIRGEIGPDIDLSLPVVATRVIFLAHQKVWSGCPSLKLAGIGPYKAPAPQSAFSNVVVLISQNNQQIIRARSYEGKEPDTVDFTREYENVALNQVLAQASARYSAQMAKRAADAQAENARRLAALEQARREQQQRELNARIAAAHGRYDEFVKQTGVEVWLSPSELMVNPFLYQGKVVALVTHFGTMIAKDQGIFGRTAVEIPVMPEVLTSSVPTGMFREKALVILAGRVIGKESVETPILGKTLVPHLKFVGVYFCQEQNCGDVLLGSNARAD